MGAYITDMTVVTKNIVNTYSRLFEGLDPLTKSELLKRLTKSLKKEHSSADKAFYGSFGTFPDERPAEEIVEEIRATRKFREKDIKF
ncbi:MAG TPA: hypothetical protein VFE53_00560 [Mucilaginibacter sp.]|jgi:hypothetical protein|nr:hypothetical protein [Mucilaginibacter sp.]